MDKPELMPENLQKVFAKLKQLLSMIPEAPTEVEKEHLLTKCIAAENNLSESEQDLLLKFLRQEISVKSCLQSSEKEHHRPLSIPNEKYPCVSEHSESVIWDAFYKLRPILIDLLDSDHVSKMCDQELSGFMMEHISLLLVDLDFKLNKREISLVHMIMMDDIFGLGPLEQLMADSAVTDILVNGFDKIYIERNGLLRKCLLSFRDNDHLIHVIRRVVAKVGRRVDYSTPYVDARLEDGSRVNAIIPPLAIDAPSLSIRRFGKRRVQLEHMVKIGSMSLKMASFLSLAVRSRLNIIVSGGTGSGKTTLLNAMSWAIDVNDRIITIEDSAELKLKQPHVVRLETRKANTEGQGVIKEHHLVKNALRMRPDRIILGEVRGAEAFDMIQAMNTGHSGSMCTIHANSANEVASRMCNMVSMSGVEYSESVTLKQLANVINIIVQVDRMRDGCRRIVDISEVTGVVEQHSLKLKKLFYFEYDKQSTNTEVVGSFKQVSANVPERCLHEALSFGLHDEMSELFAEID